MQNYIYLSLLIIKVRRPIWFIFVGAEKIANPFSITNYLIAITYKQFLQYDI